MLALSRGIRIRRNYPAFADFLLLRQFQSLLGVIREKPTGVEHVVLISLPSPDMQAVDFVMTGGATSPERVRFRQPASKPDTANAQE